MTKHDEETTLRLRSNPLFLTFWQELLLRTCANICLTALGTRGLLRGRSWSTAEIDISLTSSPSLRRLRTLSIQISFMTSKLSQDSTGKPSSPQEPSRLSESGERQENLQSQDIQSLRTMPRVVQHMLSDWQWSLQRPGETVSQFHERISNSPEAGSSKPK